MSDEETILEMRYLYHDAVKYAWYACDHLVLDTIIEKAPPIDPVILEQMSEFDQLIEKLKDVPRLMSRQSPKGYSVSHYLDKFIIHYLFPNLSSEERSAIADTASDVSFIFTYRSDQKDVEWVRKRVVKKVEAMRNFESKLTVVQMALLDSRFCNPDSTIDFEL